MQQAYVPILIYSALAIAVPVVISILASVVGPKRPDPMKYEVYESGHPTAPFAGRFPVKFYLIAMLFVVFDVETAAFFPWAVLARRLGAYGLGAMAVFVAVLVIGDAYVWKKGGFEWR